MNHRDFLIGKISLTVISLAFIHAFLFIQNGHAQTPKETLKIVGNNPTSFNLRQ